MITKSMYKINRQIITSCTKYKIKYSYNLIFPFFRCYNIHYQIMDSYNPHKLFNIFEIVARTGQKLKPSHARRLATADDALTTDLKS